MPLQLIPINDYFSIFDSILHDQIIDQIFKILSQLTIAPKLCRNKFDEIINNICQNINHNIFLLVNDDKVDNIIGLSTLFIEPKLIHGGRNVGHIEDIVIDDRYRKYGYGKKMIDMLIELCKNNDCYKIILDCNDATKTFYEKNGFVHKSNGMSLYL